ncbi:RNA polymerase sigma factor [Myxococcota bacterium]|nr:RNA polymerase sigma factor [Myxococcota bacterium]
MTRPPPSPAAASSAPDGLLPDTPAVVAVLLQNQARFLAFLERRMGSREQAEEVLQEALVKGVERHGALREEERAVAWFYRVLRNTMNDHFRRQASQRARQVDDAQVWDTLADPQDRELRDLVCGCVGRLLDTLKPEYADILRAVELQEEAVKDYGARLGISAGNAGVRVFRARKALLAQVQRSCGACATHGCVECHCEPAGAAGHGAHGGRPGTRG